MTGHPGIGTGGFQNLVGTSICGKCKLSQWQIWNCKRPLSMCLLNTFNNHLYPIVSKCWPRRNWAVTEPEKRSTATGFLQQQYCFSPTQLTFPQPGGQIMPPKYWRSNSKTSSYILNESKSLPTLIQRGIGLRSWNFGVCSVFCFCFTYYTVIEFR